MITFIDLLNLASVVNCKEKKISNLAGLLEIWNQMRNLLPLKQSFPDDEDSE